MDKFETKDSGKREEYNSGMRRDIQENKARVDLVPDTIQKIFNELFETKASLLSYDLPSLLCDFRLIMRDQAIVEVPVIIKSLIMYEAMRLRYSNRFNGTKIIASIYLRLAGLYGRGAQKYGENNWQKASGMAEYNRFKQSAHRHFLQYLAGDDDEDHFCAVLFNIYGIEYTYKRMEGL